MAYAVHVDVNGHCMSCAGDHSTKSRDILRDLLSNVVHNWLEWIFKHIIPKTDLTRTLNLVLV